MRIMVTGAAGLIGSAVADLLGRDHEVVGIDLRPGRQVQLVGDFLEVAAWSRRVGRPDAIVHVAALHAPHVGRKSDQEFRRTNVDGTARLIDFALASGTTHFVLTSTTSLYGHALQPGHDGAAWIDEEVDPEPRDIYDETKLEAERLVVSAGGAMTATVLRMSRCFPEPEDVMAWFRLHRGVDRRDVAAAHALALSRSGRPATYVISAATPFLREDRGELPERAPGVIARRCPGLLQRAREKGWMPPAGIDRVYDSALAARELGYAPAFGMEACLADDFDPPPSR